MATRFVRLLLENKQEVPEFLQMYMPDGEDLVHLKWEEESNPEDRPAEASSSWGASGGDGDNTWGGDEGGAWGGGAANNDCSGAGPAADGGNSNGWGI